MDGIPNNLTFLFEASSGDVATSYLKRKKKKKKRFKDIKKRQIEKLK
jgi:hypothetical protein